MKGTRFLLLALCAVLVILTLLSSCTTKQQPSDALTGLSEYGTTTAPPPPLTDGLTKPPNTDTYTYSDTVPADSAHTLIEYEKEVLTRIKNKKPYDELITKTADIYEFMKKYSANPFVPEKFPSIKELDEDIGIECIRKSKAGNYYSVHKLKQGGLLYIFYVKMRKDDGYLRMYNWYVVQKSLSYSDFASICEGSLYEDVEKIDPIAAFYKQRAYDYDYKYMDNPSDRKAYNFYSEHYLSDGIITIEYWYKDSKWSVSRSINRNGNFKIYHINAGSSPEYDGKILKIDAIQ